MSIGGMSLFRKPRRRAQGQSRAPGGDDSFGGGGEPASPPPAPQPRPPQMLLSFVDEVEEDTDVFKVKKSSYSKKLQKQKVRERRHKSDREELTVVSPERPRHKTNGSLPSREDDDHFKNSRKNDNFPKSSRSVEGLILSGRAAIAAGATEDLSGSDCENSDDGKDANSRFKPVFRPRDSVRALLDKGVIPDAATIHAARKRRQQAREIGEYVPLQSSNSDSKSNHHSAVTVGGKHEGRLVREDGAGDASDEDPDRIDVKGVAPEASRKDRIKLAREEGTGSDVDSGGEEWEAQQIRKAVTQNQIIAVQQETYYGNNYMIPQPVQYLETDINPFSLAPASVGLLSIASEHLGPVVESEGSPLSIIQLTNILEQRLILMEESKEKKERELSNMDDEFQSLDNTQSITSKKAPLLASRYEFYQKMRGYITDLIECLDEKMPTLNALEARALALQKRKAAFLCERRRADTRDQAQEILQTAGGVTKKDAMDEEQRRRCTEREGRRLRRRRAREQLAAGGPPLVHREGDSSDDELPQIEIAAYDSNQEQILADAASFFSDTLDEFSSIASVLSRLEDWKRRDKAAYVDAYVSLCLPRLIGPFLRLKLLLWNPITDDDTPDWDKMQWYRGLMLYGLREDTNNPENEEVLASDPDICLIPNIIQKVILPKLTELVTGTWDPMSGAQTRRLASLLRRSTNLPGAKANNRYYSDLAKAVVSRINITIQHDIFIPILPKSVVDLSPRGGSAFLKRQGAAAVRFLNNLITLNGTIADKVLTPVAFGGLLQRYLLAAIRCSPPNYSADLCHAIVTCLPKNWIDQERGNPPLQQLYTCCQEVLSNLADNVMNLKALDQIRIAINILQNGPSAKK